jgi:predicted kinase
MTLLFVQMHGLPGSGKSTLARALGKALPAVVIDKDIIKSVLLANGIEDGRAGAIGYECMHALAGRQLADGNSVVFDSPCYWPGIEERGRADAGRHRARWAMLECVCPDDELDRRLATREGLASNPAVRTMNGLKPGMYHPACERLTLDARQPVRDLVGQALRYLRNVAVPV